MGSALRFCIPQSIGKKLGEFWELIKPLVDFKYEVGQYLTLYNTTTFTVVTACHRRCCFGFWSLHNIILFPLSQVIESRLNSMFELATLDEIDKLRDTEGGSGNSSSGELELEDLEDIDKTLHIKGQMIFIQEWSLMLFLACPIMKGLNNLIWSGLFINDLSMHDYSRDIMLANAQQDMEAGLQKMQLNKKIALTKVIN